jgi:hypothetical protein
MHNSQITMKDDFSMKNLKYRFSEAKLKKNNNHCALCTVNCELTYVKFLSKKLKLLLTMIIL